MSIRGVASHVVPIGSDCRKCVVRPPNGLGCACVPAAGAAMASELDAGSDSSAPDPQVNRQSHPHTSMFHETPEHSASAVTQAGKYLTFRLGDQSYGITVVRIREIVRLAPITAIPQMPGHVRGVTNLRGKIIPVTDLRLRFGFPPAENTDQTCIIVVQMRRADGSMSLMGLLVDTVEEVLNIAAAEIEETPDFGARVSIDYILSVAKIRGAVKALIDIDRMFGPETGTVALR